MLTWFAWARTGRLCYACTLIHSEPYDEESLIVLVKLKNDTQIRCQNF